MNKYGISILEKLLTKYENSKISQNSENGIYTVLKEVITSKENQKQKENLKPYQNQEIICEIIKMLER